MSEMAPQKVAEHLAQIPALMEGQAELTKSISKLVEFQVKDAEISKSKEEIEKSMEVKMEAKVAEIQKSYNEKLQEHDLKFEEIEKSSRKQGAMVHNGNFDPVDTEREISKSYAELVLKNEQRSLLQDKEYINKSISCLKHFAKENPNSSVNNMMQSCDIEKAIHNTQDSELGGILANAPVFLGTERELIRISPMRQLTNVISVNESDKVEIALIDSYGEADFMLEGGNYPLDTAAKINNKLVKASRVGFGVQITDTVLRKGLNNNRYGVNLVNVISEVTAQQIMKKFDISFVQGATKDGNGVIEGLIPEDDKTQLYSFTNIDGNLQYARDKVLYVKSGDASNFTYDTLIDLISSLEYSPSNVLMFNSQTKAYIEKFKTSVGGTQFLFNYNTGEGVRNGLLSGRINGIPFVINERMPNIATNAFPIFYGDIKKAYTIIDFFGSTFLQRDPIENKTIYNFVSDKFTSAIRTGTQYYRLLKIAA